PTPWPGSGHPAAPAVPMPHRIRCAPAPRACPQPLPGKASLAAPAMPTPLGYAVEPVKAVVGAETNSSGDKVDVSARAECLAAWPSAVETVVWDRTPLWVA